MSVLGLTMEWRIGSESGPDVLQRMSVAFERAGAELVEMGKHVFPLLPAVFEAAEARQFDAEGGGPHGGWAELSEAYAAWKTEKFPGKPILERTGALREGLTAASTAFGVRDWSASTFNFGTVNVPYASFHQSGTSKMPVRPPFDFDDAFEKDLQTAARKGVNEALKAADLDNFVGTIPEAP